MGETYVVCQRRLKYFRKKKIDVCSKCGKPFAPGDVVINRSANRKRRKIYHLACWQGMFFEP